MITVNDQDYAAYGGYEEYQRQQAKNNTYDYIETRVAFTDFIWQNTVIEMLLKYLQGVVRADLIEEIEQDVKTQPIDRNTPSRIRRRVEEAIIEDSSDDGSDSSEQPDASVIEDIFNKIELIFNVLSEHTDNIELLNQQVSRINELTNNINNLYNDVDILTNQISVLRQKNVELSSTLEQTQKELEQIKRNNPINVDDYKKLLAQYQRKLEEFIKSNKELHDLLVKYKKANERLHNDNIIKARQLQGLQHSRTNKTSNICCDIFTPRSSLDAVACRGY